MFHPVSHSTTSTFLLEHSSYAVLDYSSKNLTPETSEAPPRRELIGPLLFRISVAERQMISFNTKLEPIRYIRIRETNRVGDVEYQSKQHNRDEAENKAKRNQTSFSAWQGDSTYDALSFNIETMSSASQRAGKVYNAIYGRG